MVGRSCILRDMTHPTHPSETSAADGCLHLLALRAVDSRGLAPACCNSHQLTHLSATPKISSDGKPLEVQSPFSQTVATVRTPEGLSKSMAMSVLVLIVFTLAAPAGYYLLRYATDPFRTLPSFPIAKYLDDYRGLAGSHYKALLRVENDLGWKDKGGRLMLFSTQDDPRPFAILLPPAVAKGTDFTKGQIYLVEIEVKEGGLIYADQFRKD